MKRILRDERGSTLIEAAIYFPIIIVLVIGMVVVALFKIDKMMTQACMSEKSVEIQSTYDDPNEDGREYYWIWNDPPSYKDYYMENSIFTWTQPTEKQYAYGDKYSPCWLFKFDYRVTNPRNWFGLVKTNTTHGGIILNNPRGVAYASEYMKSICCHNVLGNNIGYSYEIYLEEQYGY